MLCYLKLVGTDGLSKGAEFFVKQGDSALMGRSRDCSISLGKLARYNELDEEKDSVALTKFRTVDGKHIQIHFKNPNHVSLEDISENGSFIDGNKLKGNVILTNLKDTPSTLLLGLEERFRLELLVEAEEEAMGKKVVPSTVDEDGRPRTDEVVIEDLEKEV